MKTVILEIILHSAVMKLPYSSVGDALAAMEKIRPLIGQSTNAFRNGDREHIITLICDEGPSDICVDYVQAVSLNELAKTTAIKGKIMVEEGETLQRGLLVQPPNVG